MPRRVAALLLLALALAPAAAAQRGRQAVGFQAGYARASLDFVDVDNALEPRSGAFVGVYYRARLLSWLSLQSELDFTVKGGDLPVGDLLGDVERVRVDLGVLEVPLLARISTPYRRESLRPSVFGGVSVGFEIGCGRTVIAATAVRSVECSDSGFVEIGGTTLQVRPIDVGSPDVSWVVGGGIQWERRDINIALEARFQRGLRQVFPSLDQKVRNQLWTILVALTI
jgi:hypothetical protein